MFGLALVLAFVLVLVLVLASILGLRCEWNEFCIYDAGVGILVRLYGIWAWCEEKRGVKALVVALEEVLLLLLVGA